MAKLIDDGAELPATQEYDSNDIEWTTGGLDYVTGEDSKDVEDAVGEVTGKMDAMHIQDRQRQSSRPVRPWLPLSPSPYFFRPRLTKDKKAVKREYKKQLELDSVMSDSSPPSSPSDYNPFE